MTSLNIDGNQLKNMIISGANNLDNNKVAVNALNVFPVPDGDTGTNMSMTMLAAVREVKNAANHDIYSIAEAAANGSLMGARGNSGVILSQIFRGFAKSLKKSEKLDTAAMAAAIMEGSNTAYKAIMKPTEGTILTVIRESAEHGMKISESCSTVLELMEEVIKKANNVLDRTPELLPVLKNAGVVDAGGKGLIYILEGMCQCLKSGVVIEAVSVDTNEPADMTERPKVSGEEIVFGYCTEFFVKGKNIRLESFKSKLADMGDSIVVVGEEYLVKVHIHTNNPGKVLETALEYGELSRIKIDNMREQHNELYVKEAATVQTENTEKKKYAAITVAMGDGISNIFRDIGADEVIEGGQTMNPSTEDILNSVNKLNADNIVIFPNNSNIILAANQAKSLSDKNIMVAPTKTIPQGISALMALDSERSAEENAKKIERAIANVKTGLVTYAVRNSTFDGINIEEGNILGILEGKIKEVGDDILDVSKEILDEMIDDDASLVSIYYGSEVKEEDAALLEEYISENYDDCEVELHYGGQPLYYYILSVE